MDETLVHTLVASNEKHAGQLYDEHSEHFAAEKFSIRYDGWYVSFKRNITTELIEFCNELVGKDNVYILSHGTLDYVCWVNTKLKLGLDPNTHIHAREDIQYVHSGCPKFRGQCNILIDNETYEWHETIGCSKISYLDEIPKSQFIKIEPFSVFEKSDSETDQKILDKVKTRLSEIVKAHLDKQVES